MSWRAAGSRLDIIKNAIGRERRPQPLARHFQQLECCFVQMLKPDEASLSTSYELSRSGFDDASAAYVAALRRS